MTEPSSGRSGDPSNAEILYSSRRIDEDTPDIPPTDQISNWIDEQIKHYERMGNRDELLWEDFRADFARWKIEDFKKMSQHKRGELRSFLRSNGVYVTLGEVISIGLTKVLDEKLPTEWPKAELLRMANFAKDFNSCRNPQKNPQFSRQEILDPREQSPLALTQKTQKSIPTLGISSSTLPDSPIYQKSRPDLPTVKSERQSPFSADQGRGIQTLSKIYLREDKYSGAKDVLDVKLLIFYSNCFTAGVEHTEYPIAFSTMLTNEARNFYFTKIAGRQESFENVIKAMKAEFETEQRQERVTTEWEDTKLEDFRNRYPEKPILEVFDIMRNQLLHDQNILRSELQSDIVIRDKLYRACRNVPECNMALFKRSSTFQGASEDLRNCLAIQSQISPSKTFTTDSSEIIDTNNYYSDRKYHGKTIRYENQHKTPTGISMKKCFICKKNGCWSTNHPEKERKFYFNKFKTKMQDNNKFYQYVIEYEGLDPDTSKDYDQFINDIQFEIDTETGIPETNCTSIYITDNFGEVNGEEIIKELETQSAFHKFSSKYNINSGVRVTSTDAFLTSRYSTGVFMGIMIDTGAANLSTAGQNQFLALQKIQDVKLDSSRAGEIKVQFGIGETISLGTTDVITPIGKVTFHVVPADTPFLLSLQDLDNKNAQFDNLNNVLIQNRNFTPIIRAYGHPWMLLDKAKALTYINQSPNNSSPISCHLTEVEIRRLHRRFGHPSAERFRKVLQRAGHDINFDEINLLNKYCKECQTHGKAPGRFKFTLKDDNDFNHTVFIDVFYLDNKPVIHIVDEATNFQNARFLDNISAEHTWDTVREAWCDTYIGPPAYIIHDPGTNFNSKEFRDNARMMNINTIMMPVEAHQSIGRVERYHVPLRRAYNIINEEVPNLPKRMKLQMAVKAINDTAGPNGLIPTLLVFGAFPRVSQEDAPAASIISRATAIRKAMSDVRKCHAARKVADALATRNGPITSHLSNLPLNSEVVVFREGRGWSEPCRLIGMDGQTCQVEINGRPTNFRSTVVRPFYREEPNDSPSDTTNNPLPERIPEPSRSDIPDNQTSTQQPRRSARLAKFNFDPVDVFSFRPGSFDKMYNTFYNSNNDMSITKIQTFISEKEKRDHELSLKLRTQAIITTPGKPFELSRKKEMDSLLVQGVFELISKDAEEIGDAQIFGSRIVNEIKGKETVTPYEKSRFVIQAFNDKGKETILTQSPTIQRVSQRLMLAITPSLLDRGLQLFLRDITQAYVQSKSKLERPIYASLPKDMDNYFPPHTILKIIRPLYGIPESGTHWFSTYHSHHMKNLSMETSTYDACLLITNNENGPFGIVGMQTDDTLILGDNEFLEKENIELNKAKLIAKPIQKLTSQNFLLFNGCKVQIDNSIHGIRLSQNGQGKRLCEIDYESKDFKQSFIEHRARGAYIASICQPEAAYDCSIAAQHRDPGKEEVKALNKRIIWQMKNLDRGLYYLPLNLDSAKLFVFVDGSFANNADLSSQIGYVIVLANETTNEGSFKITGNIVHWSSTKCKRITRAILASELYGMVAGIDMGISITTTLQLITRKLNLPPVPVIVCTDSFSLYECLVKLGTTKEKRLMIDIMAIRQSYERRELSEIRWIEGNSNPADSMTKSNANNALKSLVQSNALNIKVQGWVQREAVKQN